MEALGFPTLNTHTISCSTFPKPTPTKLLPYNTNHLSSFYPKQTRVYRTHHFRRSTARMQADNEDFELKQMKDMAAAKKRWDALAWVKGSTWVPIFDVGDGFDAGTLSRKVMGFTMGGWWSGVPTLSFNNQFLSKVDEKFPKDTDLIVACQKGLRSIAACEVLYNTGYRNLFWVQGGLEAAVEEDLVREGPQPFKLAGIGGVSEFLGWTDQQRAAAAKEGWGYQLMFSARLVGIFIAADALLLGGQQLVHYLQDIRSH